MGTEKFIQKDIERNIINNQTGVTTMYITQSKVIFLNVAKGKMRRSSDGKEIAGFVGAITGISTKEKQYKNNPPITELRIGLQSPGISTPHILCCSLVSQGVIMTFARMLLARLISKSNNLIPGEVLEIKAYDAGETNGACCSVRRNGHVEYLPGAEIPKEPKEKCLETCLKAVEYLQGIYGVLQIGDHYEGSDNGTSQEFTDQPFGSDHNQSFGSDDDLPF